MTHLQIREQQRCGVGREPGAPWLPLPASALGPAASKQRDAPVRCWERFGQAEHRPVSEGAEWLTLDARQERVGAVLDQRQPTVAAEGAECSDGRGEAGIVDHVEGGRARPDAIGDRLRVELQVGADGIERDLRPGREQGIELHAVEEGRK